MGFASTATIPILPLGKGVLLPAAVPLRIPISNRADVPALFSSAFPRSVLTRSGSTTLTLGCVPLNSPYLSHDGQQLLENRRSENGRRQERSDINPSKATKDDLFSYGTLAKIVNVQGQPGQDPYIVVEGIQRFRINQVSQERPYFEAEVVFYDDGGTFYASYQKNIY